MVVSHWWMGKWCNNEYLTYYWLSYQQVTSSWTDGGWIMSSRIIVSGEWLMISGYRTTGWWPTFNHYPSWVMIWLISGIIISQPWVNQRRRKAGVEWCVQQVWSDVHWLLCWGYCAAYLVSWWTWRGRIAIVGIGAAENGNPRLRCFSACRKGQAPPQETLQARERVALRLTPKALPRRTPC